jgi:hypothetical protein
MMAATSARKPRADIGDASLRDAAQEASFDRGTVSAAGPLYEARRQMVLVSCRDAAR